MFSSILANTAKKGRMINKQLGIHFFFLKNHWVFSQYSMKDDTICVVSKAALSLVIESMSFTHFNELICLSVCLDITVDKTAIVMSVLNHLRKLSTEIKYFSFKAPPPKPVIWNCIFFNAFFKRFPGYELPSNRSIKLNDTVKYDCSLNKQNLANKGICNYLNEKHESSIADLPCKLFF